MTQQMFDDDLVADAIAASNRPTIDPVELVIRPEHSYVAPPKGKRGCRHVLDDSRNCGAAQFAFIHNLPSLNQLGVRSGWFTMDGALKMWRAGLAGHLRESGLPRGLDSVLVEGVATFPTRGKRDQGNHRYFVEKALGDALQNGNVGTRKTILPGDEIEGGWLTDDDWMHYEFGNLAFRYVKGERSISLRIMPNALASAR